MRTSHESHGEYCSPYHLIAAEVCKFLLLDVTISNAPNVLSFPEDAVTF